MSDEGILAIYPNAYGFGFAIIDNGLLLDYGMVPVRPMSNDKCLKRANQIIQYYQPKILIVRNISKSKKLKRICELVNEVSKQESINMKVIKYYQAEVKDIFGIFKARNKFEISRKIATMYPELKTKLPEKRKLWESENYYQAIFDALALIFTYLYLID